MLIVAKSQIAAFDDPVLARSVKDIATYLRELYPAHLKDIDPGALESRVRLGIGQAQRYGIDTVGDVRRFLEFSIAAGAARDAGAVRKWWREILDAPGLSGTRKMDLIEERMTFESLPHPGI